MFSKIVTRFAPSPTGHLHIGGARTALFNYLFAKKNDGLFKIRIEDTDQKRSSNEMTEKILDNLKWVGLSWHGNILYQSTRIAEHQKSVEILEDKEQVYPCFCSKTDLARNRKDYKYNGYCRQLSTQQIKEKKAKNIPYVLRFRVPDGETSWRDSIHGEIQINNSELEDFIVLRSDGSPTYQLAVVVDDHEMMVSHIMRGDDHISNTPKQISLYCAFGWDIPTFAHIPLIMGPDRKRLSKRHGATAIDEFRDRGILPEALFNYLAFLGWTPKSNQEILNSNQIIELFSLKQVSNTNAIFDEKKLTWFNQKYLINNESEKIYEQVLSYWQKAGFINSPDSDSEKNRLLTIITLLKTRATLLSDFIDLAKYFFERPTTFDRPAIDKYLTDEKSWDLLKDCKTLLERTESFDESEIESTVRNLAEKNQVSAGRIIHPFRLALTGRTASPGIFEVANILTKKEVIQRLDYFINKKHEILNGN